MNEQNQGLRVITLSGTEGIGRNSYVIQYDDEIFICDFGMTFPEGESYGVDYILPDSDWLIANKHKIKALVVTHAHLDHVGGIPFVIDKFGNPPIYGSPFAIEFIKEKLSETGKDKAVKLNVVGKDDVITLGSGKVSVSFFHVTHSIPQSYGVCFHTPEGRVVYSGDFKLDETPINEAPTEVDKIAELGKKGVLVALLDSTNAYEVGKSKSETEILGVLEDVIKKAEGRVIIASFSSMVTRLGGVIEAAKKLNKRVFITGRSLESNIKIAMRIGYIHPQANVFVQRKDLEKIPDNQLIILTTGSQGEPMAALTRIATNRHPFLTIKKTDTVITSSSVIPTNTGDVQRLLDAIARRGARIINSKLMNVHVSGHGYQEDMKKMALLLNAKYNIPVHGYTSFLTQHRLVLKEAGIPESRTFISVDGGVFSFKGGIMTQDKKIPVEPTLVVDSMILPKGDQMVSEKKALATDGICVVTVIEKQGSKPSLAVTLRGFDRLEKSQEIVNEIKDGLLPRLYAIKDEKMVKKILYTQLGVYFHKKHEKYPILAIDVVKV